jgi:hypothetical protein
MSQASTTATAGVGSGGGDGCAIVGSGGRITSDQKPDAFHARSKSDVQSCAMVPTRDRVRQWRPRSCDDDDVVIAIAAFGQEDDDRLVIMQARGRASIEPSIGPARLPRPNRVGQDVVGDAASTAIDERREPWTSACASPMAEDHRRPRTATRGLGLRQVRYVDRHRCRERQRGERRERFWPGWSLSTRKARMRMLTRAG